MFNPYKYKNITYIYIYVKMFKFVRFSLTFCVKLNPLLRNVVKWSDTL